LLAKVFFSQACDFARRRDGPDDDSDLHLNLEKLLTRSQRVQLEYHDRPLPSSTQHFACVRRCLVAIVPAPGCLADGLYRPPSQSQSTGAKRRQNDRVIVRQLPSDQQTRLLFLHLSSTRSCLKALKVTTLSTSQIC
jgi:hypothetical protein